PGEQLRVEVLSPGPSELSLPTAARRRNREYPVNGDRVHRRVDDPAGRRGGHRVLVVPGALPLRRSRPVPVQGGARVENDVRQQAVAPLPGEERVELEPGPRPIDRGQADRVERGVPAPLVGIEGGGGLSDEAGAVVSENVGRSRGDGQGPRGHCNNHVSQGFIHVNCGGSKKLSVTTRALPDAL